MDSLTRYLSLQSRSVPTSGKISMKNSECGSFISPSSSHLLSMYCIGAQTATRSSCTNNLTASSPLCLKRKISDARDPPFLSWQASEMTESHCNRTLGSRIHSSILRKVNCSFGWEMWLVPEELRFMAFVRRCRFNCGCGDLIIQIILLTYQYITSSTKKKQVK